MTIWHCHIAVSLDGKIARPDGSVEDWLVADYPPEGLGFEEFYDSVGAILLGRGTYDIAAGFGNWPHVGKQTYVLTHRPINPLPPDVHVRSGDTAAVAAEIEAAGHAVVWIEGGGGVIRDMMALGKLDVLELALIPIILGDGIRLFPDGTPEMRLDLDQGRVWRKGAMHLKYRRRNTGG